MTDRDALLAAILSSRMFVAPDVQRVAAFLAESNPTEKQA